MRDEICAKRADQSPIEEQAQPANNQPIDLLLLCLKSRVRGVRSPVEGD